MTYLSDAGHVILSAAAQRDDLSVLPLPETLAIKGAAVQKVLAGLRKRGLIREVQSEPQRIVITREGLLRIGVEPEDEATAGPDEDSARGTPAAPADAATAGAAITEAPARDIGETEAADIAATADTASLPGVRPGTKQALLIELLRRPEGATVQQIAERTGWQHHTIRGAISGALKKKLGLNIEATKVWPTGPEHVGDRGYTIYRIVGADR